MSSEQSEHELRRLLLTFRAVVILPGSLAFSAGLMAGILLASVLKLRGYSDPFIAGVIGGAACALITWALAIRWLLREWRGSQPPPPPAVYAASAPAEVYWPLNTSGTQKGRDVIQTATRTQLHMIALYVVNNQTITYRAMRRMFGATNAAIDAFYDEMISKGFMEWVNPDHHKSGVRVTDKGRAMLFSLLPHPPQDYPGYVRSQAYIQDRIGDDDDG